VGVPWCPCGALQLETMRRQEGGSGRAVAEKEALENVAVRLSDERDSALSEVRCTTNVFCVHYYRTNFV